jgi:hypothetical protein
MKKKKKIDSKMVMIVLAAGLTIGLPFYMASGKAGKIDKATAEAKLATKDFKAKADLGLKIRSKIKEWNDAADVLASAMPANSDVDGAIRSLQTLAAGASVDESVKWLSATTTNVLIVKPPEPVATPVKTGDGPKPAVTVAVTTTVAKTGPNVILDGEDIPYNTFDVTINIEGSQKNILAFITRMQLPPTTTTRLFSVKAVNVTLNAAAEAGVPTTPPTTQPGAPAGIPAESRATIQLKVSTFGVPVSK